MTEPPTVSIVIVAYRAREHVIRCLDSIRENVEVSHETLVVDDGSGDGTAAAVRADFPETSVIEKKVNEGLVAGRNSAIDVVRGRCVLMLDADTQVRPHAAENMLRVLDREPGVGIVGPRILFPDGRVQHSCRRWPSLLLPILRRGPITRLRPQPEAHRRHMMMDFGFDLERPVVALMGAAQMWRADLPALIGRFDPRISSYGGEDVDWCLRAWSAGLEVRFVPSSEIVHDWQHVVRRQAWSRHSLRALRDFYYLQLKHRGLRRDPRLQAAQA